MPKRWTLSPRGVASAKRAGEKYGLKTAIIVAGAAIAVATAKEPAEVEPQALVNRVVALVPDPTAPFANLTGATAKVASAADTTPGLTLDNGVKHSRIDKWISRFASSLGFKQALDRKDKYDDMITAKLDAKQMPRDLIY